MLTLALKQTKEGTEGIKMSAKYMLTLRLPRISFKKGVSYHPSKHILTETLNSE